MQPAFEFWNSLVDSGRTVSEINEILMEQMRRGDLNNRLTEIYGVERVKDLPIEADAKEIVSSFRKAGIRPSKALKEAMSAEGFDAKTVAKKAGLRPIKALKQAMLAEGLDAKILAKKGGLQPSPSNGIAEKKKSLNISENQLSELYKLLHQYHNDDSSDKDRNSLLNSIQGVLGGVEMIGIKEVARAHETNQKMIKTV